MFSRGAKIQSPKPITWESDLKTHEAAIVTILLWRKEFPDRPDGDFLRYMLRAFDGAREAGFQIDTYAVAESKRHV